MAQVSMTVCAVICTFNRVEYLTVALESVLGQSRPPDEVIVVFDGGDRKHYESMISLFPGVRFIYQENQGRSIAANRAVYESTCEYVAFLDDDDYWYPDKLEIVCGELRESGADALNHFYDTVSDGAVEVADCSHMLVRNADMPFLILRNPCAFSTTVLRRELYFLAGGLVPFQTLADDWTLYMNVTRLAEWVTLPIPLACYRLHSSQISSNVNGGLRILAQTFAYYYGGRPSTLMMTDVDAALLDDELFAHAMTSIWKCLKVCRLRRAFQSMCLLLAFSGSPFIFTRLLLNSPPVRSLKTKWSRFKFGNR
jgi:glycosyltransferase involved in cell wall biosynthesis